MKRALLIILLIIFSVTIYANKDLVTIKIDVVDIAHKGLIDAIRRNVLSDSICRGSNYMGNIIIAKQHNHLYSYAYVGIFPKLTIRKSNRSTQNKSVFTLIDNYPFFLNVINDDPHKYYTIKKKNYKLTYSHAEKKTVDNKIWIFLLLSNDRVLLTDTLSINTREKQSGHLTNGVGEVVYGDAFDFRDGADEDVEYGYDANGNMTSDSNSGITSIEYDTNNLPCSVVIGGTSRNLYTYDASGRKLRSVYQVNYFEAEIPDIVVIDSVMKPSRPIDLGGGGGIVRPMPLGGLDGSIIDFEPAYRWRNVYTRDYCGDIVYKDGEIERILTDNGYAVPDSAGR